MVDQGGAYELTDEDKEHRIAHPEMRGDEGDGKHVKGYEAATQKEVAGGGCGFGKSVCTVNRQDDQTAEERDRKEDSTRGNRVAQMTAKRGIKGS